MKEIVASFEKFGFDFVKSNYGIQKHDTVRRYKDFLKQRGIPIPTIENKNDVKILIFDIETSRAIFKLFRTGKQYVSATNIAEKSFIICWRGKWLNEDEVFGDCVTPDEALERDDERVVHSLYKKFASADIVIGHNIAYFDIPRIKAKFMQYDLPTLAPYETYDTLLKMRKTAFSDSYALDYLCQDFKLGGKQETNKQLWEDCESGDEEALQRMFDYCGNDVVINEKLYLKIRGIAKGHPNLALYTEDEEACPVCLGKDFEEVREYRTNVNRYTAYRCKSCGAIKRNRRRVKIVGSDYVLTAK